MVIMQISGGHNLFSLFAIGPEMSVICHGSKKGVGKLTNFLWWVVSPVDAFIHKNEKWSHRVKFIISCFSYFKYIYMILQWNFFSVQIFCSFRFANMLAFLLYAISWCIITNYISTSKVWKKHKSKI